jgi:hypothetical protein
VARIKAENPGGAEIFFFFTAFRPAGAQMVSFLLEVLPSQRNQPGLAADHLLFSSSEVKNKWNYFSTPSHSVFLN